MNSSKICSMYLVSFDVRRLQSTNGGGRWWWSCGVSSFPLLLQVLSHLYCILRVLYRKQQSQKAATALSRPKTAPRFWWSLALHTPLKSTSFIALERAWKMLHFTPRKCVGTWSVLWNMPIQRFWWVRGPNLACSMSPLKANVRSPEIHHT